MRGAAPDEPPAQQRLADGAPEFPAERPERLEVELVRDLERAYASGLPPPVVAHARPYQWANACSDLFVAGRIDVCEYAARHLHGLYPDLTYLATLVALFDGMARGSAAPLAFRDDPAAEIQVVRRPECDVVLLCFCARNGTLGLPINFVHEWLGRLPASLVYIKDFRDLAGGRGFPTLGPDRAAAIAAFRRIVAELEAKAVYTFGVSGGGYAALYYGLELAAVATLCLAGATDFTPAFIESFEPVSHRYVKLREQAPDYTRNLRESFALARRPPHVLIAYSVGYPPDRRQAERLAGLPNVELVPVDYAHHNVIEPLIREGRLMTLLQRLLANR